ncbi:type VII secretion target [Actinokineospora iranica]|uniref:Excreted virulence factor EspC, type VII ESX diderm n=1 Tax=Actinokineospora iranica TaxID=1271860 RepID=A0A1G6ZH97_9PSEU|nr:type VII secretion target [Actinokineospora iranica]SDE01195.1 Excreted virulence factor EspC, type VII ESX diderm [Actinokineospora iranica]
MPDGMTGVFVGELRAHATRLDALGERLSTAADAGRQVTMGTEAYGKICQFFVPVVQSISTPGIDAIAHTATTVAESAQGIRDTANAYEQNDQSNAQSLGGGQ